MSTPGFPLFRPHPLLFHGHLQTLPAFFCAGADYPYAARQHQVELEDKDRIVLHDDCPGRWQPSDRSALLIHGLGGSYRSPYLVRIAARLNQHGVRTFRMDLRGCGAGAGLARRPYHAGQSDDVAAALRYLAEVCPQSPTALVGFSLGGNLALKLLGEGGPRPPGNLDRTMAICPPIDLAAAVGSLDKLLNRYYDRYFVRRLLRQASKNKALRPDAPALDFPHRPRRLYEFDDLYTAPVCGFGRADNYYQRCSSLHLVGNIKVPTLVLAARDDPMIPVALFERAAWPSAVRLELTDHGGHLGFISRAGPHPDRRWLDGRVVHWVMHQR